MKVSHFQSKQRAETSVKLIEFIQTMLSYWIVGIVSLSLTTSFFVRTPFPTVFQFRQKSLRMALDEVVIVGSGPVGLATAIMFAQNGVKSIKVLDQLKEPADPDDSKILKDSTKIIHCTQHNIKYKVLYN